MPQYTAITATEAQGRGREWPYKGTPLKGLMGKETAQGKKSTQRCTPEGSTYLLEVSCPFTSQWLQQGWKYDHLGNSQCSYIRTNQLDKRCTHVLNLNLLLWILSSLSAALGRHPCILLEEVNSRNTGLRPKTHTHLGESDPTKDKNNVNQTRAPHGPAPNMKNMQPAQTRPTRRERLGNLHCLL